MKPIEKYRLLMAVPIVSIVSSVAFIAFFVFLPSEGGAASASLSLIGSILNFTMSIFGLASLMLGLAALYFGWQARKHLNKGAYFWVPVILFLLIKPLQMLGLELFIFPVMALIGLSAKIKILRSSKNAEDLSSVDSPPTVADG